ncbi:phage portal protein [Guyparkeria sp. 1SP6A2]|nr:phage portal protein [Guyparkeria sp. 1SP6A2]
MSETTTGKKMEAFTFGDPEPILDGPGIMDYLEAWSFREWYEPPVSFEGLAKSMRANPHHSSALLVKRNILLNTLEPHPALSRQDASRLFLDYLVFGNCYPEQVLDRGGRLLRVRASPSKYTRRGRTPGQFWFVPNLFEEHEFEPGSVFQLMEPDINQEIYGLPEYLSGLQAAWLSESATLFRRKYYKNGSHAGFILYLNDESVEQEDVDSLRSALKDSKGPGNFKNLFMHAPGGKKDGIQLIPVSEVAAKDEFFNIKTVARDDVLAAHRVPPQLMGIVPTNTAGFGSAETAAQVFATNEIEPIQTRVTEINDWLGEEVFRWRPYTISREQ